MELLQWPQPQHKEPLPQHWLCKYIFERATNTANELPQCCDVWYGQRTLIQTLSKCSDEESQTNFKTIFLKTFCDGPNFRRLPRTCSGFYQPSSGSFLSNKKGENCFVMILLQRWNQAERTNTKIQQYRLGSSLPTHISEADPVTLWNRLLSPQVIAGIKIIKTLRRWF